MSDKDGNVFVAGGRCSSSVLVMQSLLLVVSTAVCSLLSRIWRHIQIRLTFSSGQNILT